MINSKTVLISGATGFVGSCLTRRLVMVGCNLHIIKRKQSNIWRLKDILNRVVVHNVDLIDGNSLERLVKNIKPKIIFHLAAYGVYVFQKGVNRIMETNLLGTMNLINACKNIEFDLFVNTGSVFEYGIKPGSLQENDLLEPMSDYGISKAASTLYCQAIGKRENKPVVTLRLFTPYGYYEEPLRLIPSVIISCLEGENPKVSSPDSVRDFVFIEDVIDAYVKVAENSDKSKGEIFNIGYGEQYPIGEAVSTIIELTGNKARPEWGSVPNYRIESKMWQANISKAKRLLNWQPKYALEQGLRKTVKWFEENIGLYEDKYRRDRKY